MGVGVDLSKASMQIHFPFFTIDHTGKPGRPVRDVEEQWLKQPIKEHKASSLVRGEAKPLCSLPLGAMSIVWRTHD